MTKTFAKTRREMIEASGRLWQVLGLPRSTGQVYGLLYLSTEPLSLDDMVELLGISKTSASIATRQLASWGAIKQVWVPGERRDYYELVEDLGRLIRGVLLDFLKPRLESSHQRLESMVSSLEEELGQGIFAPEEYQLCAKRLRDLSQLQQKIQSMAPLAERLL